MDDEEEDGEAQPTFGESLCAECETGGVLDTCDGCVRSWHIECLNHSIIPAAARIHPG